MDKRKITTVSRTTEFLRLADADWNALIAHLQNNFCCEIKPQQRVSRTYYDTFDWRLYRANLSLYRDKSRKSSCYILQSVSSGAGAVVAQLDMNSTAIFAHDFIPGPLQDRLLPLLEMRALLPLANIHRKIIPVRISNKSDKTVVKLELEHNYIGNLKTPSHKMNDFRVSGISMQDSGKQTRDIDQTLEQFPGLTTTNTNLFDQVMQSVGRIPGDYTSKLNIKLRVKERADRALQIILRTLYHTMQVNESGLKSNIDSEFLHDFRVAIRRTRSALSQIKHMLPAKQVEKFKKEFSWLGTITTPPRDLDVHLLNFDVYTTGLPESMHSDLEPLRDFLLDLRNQEYKVLKKHLSSSHYRRLKKSWSELLGSDLSAQIPADNLAKPIGWVAKKTIWRTYNCLLNQGDILEPTSPAPQYHELRKACKKLRYLLEFFACLFPENGIKSLIKTLKSLQENLGEFQDLQVHAQSILEFAKQMQEKGHASTNTLMAMGTLADNLENQKIKIHEKFSVVYHSFRDKKNQKIFRTLCKSKEKTLEPAL